MSLVLNVEILGEFKKLTTATQGAQTSLQTLSTKASKFGRAITGALGAVGISLGFRTIVQGAKESVNAASDLEQQFGALDSVFKDTAPEMKTFAKDMNRIGLSSAEAARQSVLLGSMIKGAGFSLRDTGKQTKSLVTLAGDLAATFGGPTSEAVRAISALLRNEYDPIERYGVSIKKSDINARLAAEGLDKLTGEARKQAEVQAGLALLFEKTGDAQGQAARESETYASKIAEMNAKFTDTQAKIGVVLIPALLKVSDWFVSVIPDIENFTNEMLDSLDGPEVKTAFAKMEKSLGNLGFAVGTLFGSTQTDEAKGFENFWIILAGSIETVSNLLSGLLAPLSAAFGNTKPMENWLDTLLGGVMSVVGAATGARSGATGGPPTTEAERRSALQADRRNVTININKGNVTAKEIAKAVNKGTKTGGAPILTGIALRKALR
jgi:hypothetical protein